jgi:hypothetical protein
LQRFSLLLLASLGGRIGGLGFLRHLTFSWLKVTTRQDN